MSQGWCTIESDPGVFTELISQIGIKGVQVSEIYELNSDTMDAYKPVYGLIFLFKWVKDDKDNRATLDNVPEVFFAKQMISNACATQAILNVLFNRKDIDLGPTLTNFKEFAVHMPADLRGEQIGNCESIKTAHNSFARPEPFIFESKAATKDDDVYHFVGYVPVGKNVYELDGLKSGPILLGEFEGDKWLDVARPAIQERIQRYQTKEIRFNLLAIIKSRQDIYEERVKVLKAGVEEREIKLTDAGLSAEQKSTYQTEIKRLGDEKRSVELQIKDEKEKRTAWSIENVRRRHNYIPFIFNLLKVLAEKDKLKGLREEGKKEMDAREKKKEEEKKKNADKEKAKKEEENKKNAEAEKAKPAEANKDGASKDTADKS